jgi:hypothetical protein
MAKLSEASPSGSAGHGDQVAFSEMLNGVVKAREARRELHSVLLSDA